MRLRCLLLAWGLMSATAVLAQWHSLVDESELTFIVSFEGLEIAGRFAGFQVYTNFDPNDPSTAQLEVQVDLRSADMNDAEVNQEIAGPVWFDVPGQPQASFRSQHIFTLADGFVAHGTLELKGVRRPVQVPFSWVGDDSRSVMTGELAIDRRHFEIGIGEWADDEVIGYPVTVKFRVTLVP
ncbi:MAG: YceI family protein [Gammaproteobacteria bacterium]|nr:YceI family protein [Gammaproteobacteria bacterium]